MIMKKLILFFFALSAFSLNIKSQNEPNAVNTQPENKKACIKIATLSISSGVNNYRIIGHYGNGFNSRQSSKDQNNLQSGNNDLMMGRRGGDMTSRSQLNLEIGFNPYSKKLGDYNKDRELIFGLYYSGSDLKNTNSNKFIIAPGDTFSHNSVVYQTDTIKRSHKTYREEANVFGVSAQYLYKTNTDKRFSLFAGYGLNMGYAITARIFKRSSADSVLVLTPYNVQPNFNDYNNGTVFRSNEQKSSMEAKSTFFTSVFIPFGVNFRLSKTKEIWSQMNLFVNASVGLETEIVVDRRAHYNPYMGCSVGFKFNLK